MSNEKAEAARLPGYVGPLYPKALSVLHQTLYGEDSPNLSVGKLLDVAERYGMAYVIERWKTCDNYYWFCCLVMSAGDAIIVIALPRSRDREKSDGTCSDRHCAVYTQGQACEEALGKFITKFTEAMKSWASDADRTA